MARKDTVIKIRPRAESEDYWINLDHKDEDVRIGIYGWTREQLRELKESIDHALKDTPAV